MISGDYRIFCMFISQRYIPPEENDPLAKFDPFYRRGKEKKSFKRPTFSKEDREVLEKVRDDMINDMKRIPPRLFLVLR